MKNMNNMNNGYFGYSMSNRAAEALSRGSAPLSHWNKQSILEALEDYRNLDFERIKKYSVQALKWYFLRSSEWHHMSKYCNPVDFYEIDERVAIDPDYDVLNRKENELKSERKAKNDKRKKETASVVKAKVLYEENVSRFSRYTNYKKFESYCLIVGNWAYFENGTKKKIDGKHILKVEKFKKAPSGTAAIFKQIEKELKK